MRIIRTAVLWSTVLVIAMGALGLGVRAMEYAGGEVMTRRCK